MIWSATSLPSFSISWLNSLQQLVLVRSATPSTPFALSRSRSIFPNLDHDLQLEGVPVHCDHEDMEDHLLEVSTSSPSIQGHESSNVPTILRLVRLNTILSPDIRGLQSIWRHCPSEMVEMKVSEKYKSIIFSWDFIFFAKEGNTLFFMGACKISNLCEDGTSEITFCNLQLVFFFGSIIVYALIICRMGSQGVLVVNQS